MSASPVGARFTDLPDHAYQEIAVHLLPDGTPWSQIPSHVVNLRLLHPRFCWAMTYTLLESVTLDLDASNIDNSQGFLTFRRGVPSTYPTKRLTITQGPRPQLTVSKKGKETNRAHLMEASVATVNKHLLQAINACRSGLSELEVSIDEGTSRRMDGFSYLAERGTSFFALPNLKKLKIIGDHVNGLLPALCTAAANLSSIELERASPEDKAWISRKYFVESSPFACNKVVALESLIVENIAWFADQFNLTRFFLQPRHLILTLDISPSQSLEDILWGIASLPTCGTTERLERVTVTSDKGLCKKDGDDILVAIRDATPGAEVKVEWAKMKVGRSNKKKKKSKTAQRRLL